MTVWNLGILTASPALFSELPNFQPHALVLSAFPNDRSLVKERGIQSRLRGPMYSFGGSQTRVIVIVPVQPRS